MDTKEIVRLVIEECKNSLGKGPSIVKVYIDENCLHLTIKDSLTPLEKTLLRISEANKQLIWDIRKQIIDSRFKTKFDRLFEDHEVKLNNYIFDFDFQYDQQIMVLIFNKPLRIKDKCS